MYNFEEWKLRNAQALNELKKLESEHVQLSEQLFFLELQQKTSILQYKKILMLIGTNIIDDEETRKKHSLPFAEKPPTNQYQMKNNDFMKEFKTMQDQIKENNEKLLHISLLSRIFTKVCSSIELKEEKFEDEIEDVNKLYQEKEMLIKKKEELEKEKEYLWRSIMYLCGIGQTLSLQLNHHIKKAEKLILENKWYPYEARITKNRDLRYHYEAFSIPE